MKTCIECKHYKYQKPSRMQFKLGIPVHQCHDPANRSVITGDVLANNAVEMRKRSQLCGPEGAHWEHNREVAGWNKNIN